jgi:antitoxin component of RelBE/YafQ-DinJ toxin-antitoxin module
MNLTLSVDEDVVQEARATADAMGISLNEAVRRYLADLAGRGSLEEDLAELRELSLTSGGDSKGWRFNREELHERT